MPIVLSILGLAWSRPGRSSAATSCTCWAIWSAATRSAAPARSGSALDPAASEAIEALADGTPLRVKAGSNDLGLVRIDGTLRALHAVCAHAGGPLDQGRVVDGCIECPWHASRFRLEDGAVRQGPSVYDQPAYEIRAVDGGGYEVRRAAS